MIDSAILWAVALGAAAAASLPLGSAVGLILRPVDATTGSLAAFGAGALLAAVAVEIVAPSAAAIHGPDPEAGMQALVWLLAGAAIGATAFVLLDQLVSARGGALRKVSTTISQFRRRQKRDLESRVRDLCGVSLLRRVPPEQVGGLVRDVRSERFYDGDVLFQEGDPGDRIHFIRSGQLDLLRGGEVFTTMGAGDVVGELSLLTGAPRTATARARGLVETLVLHATDLDNWRLVLPHLDKDLRELASERLKEIAEAQDRDHQETQEWTRAAIRGLREGTSIPTPAEMRIMNEESPGSPLAVWLGLALDGIPESVVIGCSLSVLMRLHGGADAAAGFAHLIPWTLVAGVFLSNLPEASSSSVGMRAQAWHPARIFGLWTSLVGLAAAGTGLGYAFGEWASPLHLAGVEGAAAGAMLAMLASTMIPESVLLGGRPGTALGTVAGFLVAVAFGVLG